MIIEKKDALAPGEVIAVRLVNGDEIVGKLVSANGSDYVVARPVAVQVQMIGPQQAGIGFAPFMVGADDNQSFTIPLANMLTYPVKARKDMAANYLKATTGLEIPANGAKGLIGL